MRIIEYDNSFLSENSSGYFSLPEDISPNKALVSNIEIRDKYINLIPAQINTKNSINFMYKKKRVQNLKTHSNFINSNSNRFLNLIEEKQKNTYDMKHIKTLNSNISLKTQSKAKVMIPENFLKQNTLEIRYINLRSK